MATTWLVRKTGANANGGTSASVLATGTDGATAGTNTLTSASALFTAGMVGQGICIVVGGVNQLRTITAFNSSTSINFSGATIATATGRTWTVGGAWLTLNNALVTTNSVAAGDSIYLGAGIYRETTAVAKSGSAGNVINVIGDVDGAKTGDAGQVTVSAYTTNDKTAPSGTTLLALGTSTFLAFSLLTFVGGTASSTVSSSAGVANVTFTDCVFNALLAVGNALSFTSSTTGLALNITIERCVVVTRSSSALNFSLATTASGSADWDALCVIRNCLVISQASTGITITSTSANAFLGGGVRIYNCTILGTTGVSAGGAHLSTTIPCEVHNSVVIASTALSATTSGNLTEDHNLIYSGTARTNVTAGTGSISDNSYAPLVELGQASKWGAIPGPFLAPDGAGSPLLGFGSGGSPAVTADWQNRPRPSGGGSASKAAGYMERHDFATQDTVTYNDSPSSGLLTGPGDQYIQVPVDAVSSTISIYLRFSGYGGTNYPSATLLANGELGVSAETKTCSSSSSTWQQLTFTAINPSKAGWVTIQVSSFDTNGTGAVNFDTLAVA